MRQKNLLLVFLVLVLSFATAEELFAQKGGGAGKAPPGPTQPPQKPPPSGLPPSSKVAPKKPKSSLKELDEERKRIREKREKAEEASKSSNPPPTPAAPATPPGLVMEPMGKGDVTVISTSWRIEAKRGQNPFILLTVKVANLTDSFIAVRDFRLTGRNLKPLNPTDPRPLPRLPMTLKRFSDQSRIPAPMGPRGRQILTFALPFALKSAADLKAEVGRYVKFKTRNPLDWDPVNILSFDTAQTVSRGRNHQGIFLVVENKAPYPVKGRLKVALDGMESAGGGTFFFQPVVLNPNERKTVMVRTIPDEGLPLGDPRRDTFPETFDVKSIKVTDLQF